MKKNEKRSRGKGTENISRTRQNLAQVCLGADKLKVVLYVVKVRYWQNTCTCLPSYFKKKLQI